MLNVQLQYRMHSFFVLPRHLPPCNSENICIFKLDQHGWTYPYCLIGWFFHPPPPRCSVFEKKWASPSMLLSKQTWAWPACQVYLDMDMITRWWACLKAFSSFYMGVPMFSNGVWMPLFYWLVPIEFKQNISARYVFSTVFSTSVSIVWFLLWFLDLNAGPQGSQS